MLPSAVCSLELVDVDRALFVHTGPSRGWARVEIARTAWEELGAPLRVRISLEVVA